MASTTLTARFNQSVTKEALRSYLAEFISTFFYVFAVVGSAMASSQYPEQFELELLNFNLQNVARNNFDNQLVFVNV